MKYFVAMLFSIVTCNFLSAQTCTSTLSGKVVDYHNGTPLVNATIKISGTEKVTYSDIDGKYSFQNLCNESIELEVTHPECEEVIKPVLIDGDTNQKISLEHHLNELEEVVLTEKQRQKTLSTQEQTLGASEIEKFSSASIGEALKELSGVSSLNTGSVIVKPVIQGLHSSRVLMLNNGVRMEDQEWGVEHAPNIDLNTAGKLTVIKGASALQYGGDAIGGVVITEPERIPKKDTLYGKTVLSGSTNGRGGAVSTSLTKSFKSGWYGKIQGTFKKFGDFEAPDYVLSNTGTEEKDFSATLGLKKFKYGFDAYYSHYENDVGILRASTTGSPSELAQAINSSKPIYLKDFSYDLDAPKQAISHDLARLKFYQRFENLGKLHVQYDFQQNHRQEYDIRTGSDKYLPSVDLKLTTHTVSTNFEMDKHDDYKVNFGLDGSYQVNFPDPATGVRRLIPDFDQYKFGAFATENYEINSKLQAEAGLRYDFTRIDAQKYYLKTTWQERNYQEDFANLVKADLSSQYLVHPIFNYHNVSFSAGLKYDLLEDYAFRLNFASANRAPNPSELFSDGVHQSAAAIEIGDLRITSEKSKKVSATFQKNAGDFVFSVAPFYNHINDFIYLEPSGLQQTIRGNFQKYEYKQINARFLGVDVDAAYQFDQHFSYKGNFSYVQAKNTKTKKALIDIPPANTTHTFSYENQRWHQLTLGVNGKYVFRQNEYPNNNFETQVIQDGQYVPLTVDISTPPDAYFLLGFNASATFHPFNRGAMELGLSFSNLLDNSYRDYLNRLRYFADARGRNVSLQIKFNY